MREICTANIPSRHFKTLSSSQNPGWLGYVGDYTTQLYRYSTQFYRYYNKKNDLRVSINKTKQFSMDWSRTTGLNGSKGTHLHPLVSETDPVGLGFANLAVSKI